MTLAELIGAFLHDARHQLNPRTVEGYARHLRMRVLPAPLAAMDVATLRRRDVRRFLAGLLTAGIPRPTVRGTYVALSSCLNAAVDEERLDDNPARGVTGRLFRREPAGRMRSRAMTREQLRTFLEAAPVVAPEFADFFVTLAESGLRIGEGLALRGEHVDGDRNQLHVRTKWIRATIEKPKYDSVRAVDVSVGLIALLRTRMRLGGTGDRFLFPGRHHRMPWDQSVVGERMHRICERAGLPSRFTPHSLRHTRAVLLIEETGDLVYVSQQLGHRSVAITADCYGVGAKPRHDDAVERLDMTAAFQRRPLRVVDDGGRTLPMRRRG